MKYSIHVEGYRSNDDEPIFEDTLILEARNSIELIDVAQAKAEKIAGEELTTCYFKNTHPAIFDAVERQHAYDTGADIDDGLTDEEK
jgi:hypothetical protein